MATLVVYESAFGNTRTVAEAVAAGLGDGTEASHQRMQAAVDAEWPWAAELFDAGYVDEELLADGTAVDPRTLREPVQDQVARTLDRATLTLPDSPPAVSRGRSGLHTESFGYLLAEMQHIHRSHPGATW